MLPEAESGRIGMMPSSVSGSRRPRALRGTAELARAAPSLLIGGGFACGAAAGIAAGPGAVTAAVAPPLVASETHAIIVRPSVIPEQPVLDRFVGDLAAAPQIVGELVALYVEQYPPLALRFVSLAVRRYPEAPAAIAEAADRRAAFGFAALATVLHAAVALAAPAPDEPETPSVILDILPLDWLDPPTL